MTWIFYALGARFLWAWTNIGDKYLLTNKVKNPVVYLVIGFLADAVLVPVWLWYGVVWYGWANFWLIILEAIFFFVATFFYILAMQREEVSRINLLWNLMPLHGLWLSWIFLGEVLQAKQLIALFILLIGSVLAGIHISKEKNKFKVSKSFWLMMIATLLYVSCDTVTRYLTNNGISPLQLAGYQMTVLPILAGIFFLFKKFRFQFNAEKKNYNWKILLALLMIALFSRTGVLLNIKALSLGHISLINVLEGAQSMMVFVLAILLTFFAPKFIKEDWDKKNLLLKLVALVLMVVGIVVLNVKW